MRLRLIFIGIAVVVAAAGGAAIYGMRSGKTFFVEAEKNGVAQQTETHEPIASAPLVRDPFTGMMCANGVRRPFAVMLAGDTIARPLSGIAQADIVVEMPVLTNGITRFMAVFLCEEPDEIGSSRSSRDDFLPFAKSFDAIYAHWGGSHFALDLLNAGVLDNIDALKNPFDAFYRKDGRNAPHNGFTSFARLKEAAEKLHYRGERNKGGYPHIPDEPFLSVNQSITVAYPSPYTVEFFYDHAKNAYLRSRGGEKEMDAAAHRQVEVKNVIVMTAASHQINADYNDVDVEGEGSVTIYRNGEEKKGTWKRIKETYMQNDHNDNKYYFIDGQGNEIGLVEGKIWISIVQENQKSELKFH